jgi:hypothetical protein
MSSATSTDTVRSPLAKRVPQASRQADGSVGGVRPWQFFLATTLALAGIAVFMTRQQPMPVVTLTTLTVLAAGYAGFMFYRTLSPLVSAQAHHGPPMIAGRTRAALERDKALTLRAIKELDFDRAMGKVAEADFTEMRDRLRARAMRLLRELDGATAYRSRIEADLAARLDAMPAPAAVLPSTRVEREAPGMSCGACGAAGSPGARFCTRCGASLAARQAARACEGCGTSNEADARFCKHCGAAFPVTA